MKAGFAPLALAALLGAQAAAAGDHAAYSGHGFAPVEGTRLYYEVKGSGDPLVLIHGGQLDSRMWDDQFETLAASFRVLRYDVRGFGGSPAGDRAYSNTADLAALMDYLDMPQAHLVGLSMGGTIAGDFAVIYPGRVLSLVLSGPGLTGFDPEGPEELGRYFAMVRTARDEPPDSLVRLWLSDPIMAPAAADARIAARLEQLTRENVDAWLNNWALVREPDPPTARRLADIQAPTLILVGSRDVPSIFAVVDTMSRSIPGAKKVVIQGAGHMANMEKPAEFNAAVVEFLKGLPKRGK